MRISDLVAEYILNMLDEQEGNAEIKRNELAVELGCVPSQINYVITSRFTPEQGYIVESRRGGGGYIRISRVSADHNHHIIDIVNSIGRNIDEITAIRIIQSLLQRNIVNELNARLMIIAISERNFADIPKEYHNHIRASIFKNMLLTLI